MELSYQAGVRLVYENFAVKEPSHGSGRLGPFYSKHSIGEDATLQAWKMSLTKGDRTGVSRCSFPENIHTLISRFG